MNSVKILYVLCTFVLITNGLKKTTGSSLSEILIDYALQLMRSFWLITQMDTVVFENYSRLFQNTHEVSLFFFYISERVNVFFRR